MRRRKEERRKFAAMEDIFSWLFRRDYLLMDGMQSLAYVPRRTYRRLMKRLDGQLRRDKKAENSLRFVWTKCGDGYLLLVNPPMGLVSMNCTHGLARDSAGRVFIPCPYLQQIYCYFGLAPTYCGRMVLEEQEAIGGVLITYRLSPRISTN